MNQPTIWWFAAHEIRLAWRDWIFAMTGGRRRRAAWVFTGFLAFALFMHAVAYAMLSGSTKLGAEYEHHTLVVITTMLTLAWSGMISQALELVTRVFYTRGDLELILTSPVALPKLFTVRIVIIVVTILSTAFFMAAPFIDVLAWLGGWRWLFVYPLAASLAMIAVAVAVVVVMALFKSIGPRHTRLVAQIAAAVIGAAFAIGLQFAAIVSFGTIAVPQWDVLERISPSHDSIIWWFARAAFGDSGPLLLAILSGVVALWAVICLCIPDFGQLTLVTAGARSGPGRSKPKKRNPFSASARQTLRRKEWMLLLRDPWLISQTLMQLLYLLPAVFLLWLNFSQAGVASTLVVPVLILTSGQIGGGLAWLAISAEDAPDLIASAPVTGTTVLLAKGEAILGGVAIIFGPVVALLALVAPVDGLVAFFGILVSSASAASIQYWFQTRSKRTLFRTRQTSSRVALYAEALATTGWAAAGALAALGSWLALFQALAVTAIILGAWLISPARNAGAA